MANFRFAVSGQYLDLLTPTKGISDGLYVNSFAFDFRSPEWAKCQEKWVHFRNTDYNDGNSYDYNLVDDAVRPERGVNLPVGIWEVYLHGAVIANGTVIKRYVTDTQTIEIIQSGVVNSDPLAAFEPSVAEQVSALAHEARNARITSAEGTVDNAFGTPDVDVSISGEDAYKKITFNFHNLKGNGIKSLVFTESGENNGLITVTLSDDTEIIYDGLRDAIQSLNSLDSVVSAQRITDLENRIEALEANSG